MKLVIAFAAAGTLALTACTSKNDDAVGDNEVVTTEAADTTATDAANDAAAAEAQALSEQAAQLNQEAQASADSNPSDADEQNVAGM